MPEICRFYGIIITMYYLDHPPPHFHVRYNEARAIVRIEDFSIVEGRLSSRVSAMVKEWAETYRAELQDNWRRAEERRPLLKVPPLD